MSGYRCGQLKSAHSLICNANLSYTVWLESNGCFLTNIARFHRLLITSKILGFPFERIRSEHHAFFFYWHFKMTSNLQKCKVGLIHFVVTLEGYVISKTYLKDPWNDMVWTLDVWCFNPKFESIRMSFTHWRL